MVLRACFALAALWAFWHYGWCRFVLDAYRQRLFAIRDDLFDLAANRGQGFGFDHPAYADLRNSLNSSIRFAHRVSFYHAWIGILLGATTGIAKQVRAYKSRAALRIEGLADPKLKEELSEFVKRERSALGSYLALRSPLFLAILGIAGLVAFLTILIKRGIFGSVVVFLRAVKEQIRVRELEPSARAVQFQTDTLNSDDSDLCPA